MKTWRYLLSGLFVVACINGISGCDTRPAAAQQPQAKKPEFPGGRGERNPQRQREFRTLTGHYRQDHNSTRYAQAYYVSDSVLDAVIHQQGASGVRIYLAQAKKKGEPYLIIVGTRQEKDGHKDLISTTDKEGVTTASYLVVRSDDKCPSNCDRTSPLYHP